MKPWYCALSGNSVGTEVSFSLVRKSPIVSLTRGTSNTPTEAKGRHRRPHSYYKAQFNRLRGRHGAKKAVCAVVASMLTAIYHMLKDGTEHQDLGANHFDRRFIAIKAKRLAAQIAKLGFHVDSAATRSRMRIVSYQADFEALLRDLCGK